MTLNIADENRVRTLTLNRPGRRVNAFNEDLYHATTAALRAADDPEVSVVVVTGTAGRSRPAPIWPRCGRTSPTRTTFPATTARVSSRWSMRSPRSPNR